MTGNSIDLNRYIDISLPNSGGVLKWTRGWDGSHGSFCVPPCFSLEKFLRKMYGHKVDLEINNFSQQDGTIKATIVNPQNGEIAYLYEFLYNNMTGEIQ